MSDRRLSKLLDRATVRDFTCELDQFCYIGVFSTCRAYRAPVVVSPSLPVSTACCALVTVPTCSSGGGQHLGYQHVGSHFGRHGKVGLRRRCYQFSAAVRPMMPANYRRSRRDIARHTPYTFVPACRCRGFAAPATQHAAKTGGHIVPPPPGPFYRTFPLTRPVLLRQPDVSVSLAAHAASSGGRRRGRSGERAGASKPALAGSSGNDVSDPVD